MTVTDNTGLTQDAKALTLIGATAFADTEVGLLQQLLIAIALSA
jgi:hypothetical protein